MSKFHVIAFSTVKSVIGRGGFSMHDQDNRFVEMVFVRKYSLEIYYSINQSFSNRVKIDEEAKKYVHYLKVFHTLHSILHTVFVVVIGF